MNPPHDNPIQAFMHCYEAACAAGQKEPTAMTLATAHGSMPSTRTILFKDVTEEGWTFYTNSLSRKGKELSENPNVALLFYWSAIDVQVRVEGLATMDDPKTSDAYFATRPRISQLGAWASKQSSVISSRDALMATLKEVEKKYEGQPVPRPSHWNGYLVRPHTIELWFAGEYRLHDRYLYARKKDGKGWDRCQLSP